MVSGVACGMVWCEQQQRLDCRQAGRSGRPRLLFLSWLRCVHFSTHIRPQVPDQVRGCHPEQGLRHISTQCVAARASCQPAAVESGGAVAEP